MGVMLYCRFCSASVDHGLAIDIADESDQAFLEFVFGADANVAQQGTCQLGE